MFKALIKGTNRYISVDDCVARYSSNPENYDIHPVCPECGSKLFVYGASSLSVDTRFQHGKGKSCNIAENMHFFGNGTINIENGQKIQQALRNEQYLKQLYSFCHKLYGKNFTPEKFYELLKIAKQKNIWYYKNVEPENFGFILLTLKDFIEESKKNGASNSYIFRFQLTKNVDQPNSNISELEQFDITKQLAARESLINNGYFLRKIFSNYKLMSVPHGNPFEVSKEIWEKFSQGYMQISRDITQQLKANIFRLIGA